MKRERCLHLQTAFSYLYAVGGYSSAQWRRNVRKKMVVVTKSTSIQKLSEHEQQTAVVSRLCCWQRAFNLPPCIFDVLRVSTCFRICQHILHNISVYFSLHYVFISSATPYMLLIQQNMCLCTWALVQLICTVALYLLYALAYLLLFTQYAYTQCIHLRDILCKHTDKVVFVVDCQVRPSVLIEPVVCTPAVCHHRRLLRHVPLDNVDERRRVSFVIRTSRQKKNISSLATDASNNPLALGISPFIVFPFSELALNSTTLAAN